MSRGRALVPLSGGGRAGACRSQGSLPPMQHDGDNGHGGDRDHDDYADDNRNVT